ncbi:putative Ribonuclease H (putative) [Pseudozyma hubeiensis]|nr:putative Ribonuclease H (putative) [Pseudozyma hubeiensis]
MLVYIDGAAFRNGQPDAQAGWGVYFPNPELNPLSDYGQLPGYPQSNNRAELYAMLMALQIFSNDHRPLIIRCDSRYVKDCMENWRWKWKRNGWRTSKGKPVVNRDLIEDIEEELSYYTIQPKIEYVEAHAGVRGNEEADRLARLGAGYY